MGQSEHAEQVALFQLVDYYIGRTPELALLHAIPNAGAGAQKGQSGKMRAEGVRRGVPDLCLPVPCGGWHGLYIELKTKKGRATPEQREWIERLTEQGYRAVVCRGAEEAWQTIIEYLEEVA